MDAAGRGAGNENLRLPAGKFVTGAQGVDASRREKCARAQDNRKGDARSRVRKQGDMILPGLMMRVKSWSETRGTPIRRLAFPGFRKKRVLAQTRTLLFRCIYAVTALGRCASCCKSGGRTCFAGDS